MENNNNSTSEHATSLLMEIIVSIKECYFSCFCHFFRDDNNNDVNGITNIIQHESDIGGARSGATCTVPGGSNTGLVNESLFVEEMQVDENPLREEVEMEVDDDPATNEEEMEVDENPLINEEMEVDEDYLKNEE